MVREFIMQKKVQQIFQHSGSGFNTVESYAVIDLGFDVKHANGKVDRAGAILRRAHDRVPERAGNNFAGKLESWMIETVLRGYGLTSAGEKFPNEDFDRVNVQTTKSNSVFDFGAFLARRVFPRRGQAYFDKEGAPLMNPEASDFQQPIPGLQPPESWGYGESGNDDPKDDNLWRYAHRTAEDYKNNKTSVSAFRDLYENMMNWWRPDPLQENRFAYMRDQKWQNAKLLSLFKTDLDTGTLDTQMARRWLALPESVSHPEIVRQILDNHAHFEDLWTFLIQEHWRRAHPEFLQELALRKDIPIAFPEYLWEHATPENTALLKRMVQAGTDVGFATRMLLKPPLTESPEWDAWADLAFQGCPACAPSFLYTPRGQQRPDLMSAFLADGSSGVHSKAAALWQPGWESHPELVDQFAVWYAKIGHLQPPEAWALGHLMEKWSGHPHSALWRRAIFELDPDAVRELTKTAPNDELVREALCLRYALED
jgi:hypothetical protein